jgi:hypothetical protein
MPSLAQVLLRPRKASRALLASGQINMRKVDGWQTLTTKPIDQQIDLAA